MMKHSLFAIFFSVLLMGNTESSVASDSSSDRSSQSTYTASLELKPASLSGAYKTASVCFLGFGDCDPNVGFGKGDDYTIDTENQCKNEGFIKLNCNSVQVPTGICPYNSAYGKGCICKSGLITCPSGQVGTGDSCGGQYASCQCKPSLVSCASNQYGVGASCGGKFESCTCKPEYRYNSSNCGWPRSAAGSSCGGNYTNCNCPSGVSLGRYGCKIYYESPCGAVCQETYTDNCHNRDSVSTPYGCMNYFADCPSKCERAYPDNCRDRNDVSVPANATCSSRYSDCSSKCSAWTCNSGYNQSGNTCVPTCAAGGSATCTGQTASCTSSQVQTSSCLDCSATRHYVCCDAGCKTDFGERTDGTCGPGRYYINASSYKVTSTYRYGQNAGYGCGWQPCSTCYTGIFYLWPDASTITCKKYSDGTAGMFVAYKSKCVMSDGAVFTDDNPGIGYYVSVEWKSLNNCEAQKAILLARISLNPENVGYCRRLHTGQNTSTPRNHSSKALIESIVVGD